MQHCYAVWCSVPGGAAAGRVHNLTRGFFMAVSPDKSTVRADINKNRLYCTIAGRLKKRELDSLYTDVRFSVADLSPPFDVITDLRTCRFGMLNALPTFRKIMNYLLNSQVGVVVRVTRKDSLLHKQVINLAGRLKGYRPVYVSTMEEAEEILDRMVPRDGVRFCLLGQEVSYLISGERYEGKFIDLSVSGCAVESEHLPKNGDELAFKMVFPGKGDGTIDFELKGKVVRVEKNGFAASFTEPGETYRKDLLDCLLRESQREV